jgi:hypothetical protein
MEHVRLTVSRVRALLRPDNLDLVSLDGQRSDETYVLENRGGTAWLVFYLERGRKLRFRKHALADAACRDLLSRLSP